MLILMVTLFWALWDESFAQRPWKAFQHVWQERYSAFLNSAKSKSSQSVKQVEQESQYQQLEQAAKAETEKPAAGEGMDKSTMVIIGIVAVVVIVAVAAGGGGGGGGGY